MRQTFIKSSLIALFLVATPSIGVSPSSVTIVAGNGIIIDAQNNPMNEPGGFAVNGTAPHIRLHSIPITITDTIRLISPGGFDSGATAEPDEDRNAYFYSTNLWAGTWRFVDYLGLTTITSFDVRVWDPTRPMVVTNSTVTLFPDTANYTRDLAAAFNTTVDAHNVLHLASMYLSGSSLECATYNIPTLDVFFNLYLPHTTGYIESIPETTFTYNEIRVFQTELGTWPSGAGILPTAPGQEGNYLVQAPTFMAPLLEYRGEHFTGVLPDFEPTCFGEDTWQTV